MIAGGILAPPIVLLENETSAPSFKPIASSQPSPQQWLARFRLNFNIFMITNCFELCIYLIGFMKNVSTI